MLEAMHGRGRHGGLAVGLGDAEVESGEALVDTRHIDARLQMGMIDGKTLYYFHDSKKLFTNWNDRSHIAPRKSFHCAAWSSVRPGVSLMTRRLMKGTFIR